MLAQRPSQILGIAKLSQTDHIEIGVAIRLGHRLPGERFCIAGTTIADEPVHRGDSARSLITQPGKSLSYCRGIGDPLTSTAAPPNPAPSPSAYARRCRQ